MNTEHVIISMDSHTHSFVDLKPYLPAKHHEAFDAATAVGRRIFFEANRMWGDLLHSGAGMNWEMNKQLDTAADQYDLELTLPQRLAMIDADGIAAEFVIEGNGPVTTDAALLHEVTLAYCRWFAQYVAPARYRYAGAVIVNLLGGMEQTCAEIAAAYEHGLAAIHLSGQPQAAARDLPHFNHEYYEPMWRALDERGMVVVFHGGVGREKPLWQWERCGDGQRGWEDLLFLDIEAGNFEALKYLLLAGVPERYPRIRFGWVETGSAWVVPALANLDRFAKSRRVNPAHRLSMLPSEMWRRQCFTAGPLDAGEVAQRHAIGLDNLMFGSDFIHVEGTYPRSFQHVQEKLGELPSQERFALCAGNAARIMGFDLERLTQTPAARLNAQRLASAA